MDFLNSFSVQHITFDWEATVSIGAVAKQQVSLSSFSYSVVKDFSHTKHSLWF